MIIHFRIRDEILGQKGQIGRTHVLCLLLFSLLLWSPFIFPIILWWLDEAGGRSLVLLSFSSQPLPSQPWWVTGLSFPIFGGTAQALPIIPVKISFPPSILQLMEKQNHWVIKLIWISNSSLRKSKLLFLDEPQGLLLNFSVHFPLLAYVYIRVPL